MNPWTLKFAKAKPLANGKPGIDIAIPSFGYKNSVSICRAFGFIRKGKVTDAARFDGRMLRDVGKIAQFTTLMEVPRSFRA